MTQDDYHDARQTLQRSTTLRGDPDKLATALALKHCDKARACGWPEAELRERNRKASATWEPIELAARKLVFQLEQLNRANPLAARVRIQMACRDAGISDNSLASGTFIKVLRAIAAQEKGNSRRGGYVIGPLAIADAGRKSPSRVTALTIVLAHFFRRIQAHDFTDHGPLSICAGEAISSGAAWTAAAQFATAALGVSNVGVAIAAEKYEKDHRGHLTFRAWPRVRGNAKPLHSRAAELFDVKTWPAPPAEPADSNG